MASDHFVPGVEGKCRLVWKGIGVRTAEEKYFRRKNSRNDSLDYWKRGNSAADVELGANVRRRLKETRWNIERPPMDDTAQAKRIERLLRALKDPQVSVVWNATRELARFEAVAVAALPGLNDVLKSSDHASQLWARYAIARITDDLPVHLPVFVAALENRTTLFPGMAAAALAGFGPLAAPAVPQLIRELEDADAEYRWSAAGVLAAIGPAASDAVPALISTLNDPDEKVRWYAAWALGEIGALAVDAVPALIIALNDIDDDVRGYAARALGKIGISAAEVAVPALRVLMTDENPNLQQAATEALRQLKKSA